MRTNICVITIVVLFTPFSISRILLLQHTIDGNFPGAASVQAADVNGDSLIDVISSGLTANSIAWWNNDGIVGINDQTNLPCKLQLVQNYPNPFNPSTTILYQIPERNFVTLKIYDVLGNEIATLVDEEKPAGEYEVEFIAGGLTSGIYFYQMKADSYSSTKKILLLK
jgi:hypothetical protein